MTQFLFLNPPPFLPTDISGLKGWYVGDSGTYQDASATTPATVDDAPVGYWQDWSGQGNHVTQSTAGSRPLLRVDEQYGRNTLRFDGIAYHLRRASAFLTGSQGRIFVVWSTTAIPGSEDNLVSSASESDATHFFTYRIQGTVGQIVKTEGGSVNAIDGSTVLTASRFYLSEFASTGTAYDGVVNGSTETLTAAVGSNNGDWFADVSGLANVVIGALVRTTTTGFFSGDIAEVIIYDGVTLTAAQLASVREYLRVRYGIF